MRLVLVIALAPACWTQSQPGGVEPRPQPAVQVTKSGDASWQYPRPYRSPRKASGVFPLHSEWEGTYICNQGPTGVRLTIDATRNGEATAVFEFGPLPANPAVPNGSFVMVGSLSGTDERFEGKFTPDRWILQPRNYFMVGLTLETDEAPRKLRGNIQHPTCSEFRVTRID